MVGDILADGQVMQCWVVSCLAWGCDCRVCQEVVVHPSRRVCNAASAAVLHCFAIAEPISNCWYILAEDAARVA